MADLEEYRLRMDAPEVVDWQSSARPAETSLFQRPQPTEGRVIAPVQVEQRRETPPERYGVFAFGTNDWGNPKAAVEAARDIYANAQSMGMTPVFVLPNASHEKFAPVHNALRSFAEERGIKYEVPTYEAKDPLHLTRQSAQDIAKRYPDAFVGGDSNSVRLHNWGYGRKLATENTYVDPRTGQLLSKVGAPSKDIAGYITQYRKMLERGQYKRGGASLPNGARLIHMAPHEYLARGGALKMDERDHRLIKKYEDHIRSGADLEPAVIKHNGKLKGRHRATAAKNLGLETIPVVISPKRGKAAIGGLQGNFSSPDYARMYYQGLPQLGNVGTLARAIFPNPATTGAYDAWMSQGGDYKQPETVGKTPDFEYQPIEASNSYDLATLESTPDVAGMQDSQSAMPDSVETWRNLGVEKRKGGSVVNAALMVLSKQANRHRGRP